MNFLGLAAAVLVIAPAVWAGPVAAEEAGCSAGAAGVGAIVCDNPELAALDREAARLSKAFEGPGAEYDWLADRDDCIAASDPALCLRDAYLERIVDLRGGSAAAGADADGISIGPRPVLCAGLPTMEVTFVNAPTPLAYLATGSDPLVFVEGPTGSGARYVAKGAAGETVFWNKGSEATYARPGAPDLTCKIEG